jgi:hypothetical protein
MATTRIVNTTAVINGTDHETFGSNEHGSASMTTERVLNNADGHDLVFMICKWGGECRVELTLNGHRNNDDSVQVDGRALLYEGTSEGTSDLDGELGFSLVVPRGQTLTDTRRVTNLDEGSDFADITMTFVNRVFEG